MNRAAIKIQKWYKRFISKKTAFARMTRVMESVVVIQRGFKRWKLKYGDPRKIV